MFSQLSHKAPPLACNRSQVQREWSCMKTPDEVRCYLNQFKFFHPNNPAVIHEWPDRLWGKINRKSEEECWEWMAYKDKWGYGKIGIKKSALTAHRQVFMELHGRVSSDTLICHSCDNPICCNPFHLFAGTNLENSHDCISKGRTWVQSGKVVRRSYITSDQVKEIKHLLSSLPPKSGIKIADRFGINPLVVSRIKCGKTWRHVR